MRFAPPAYTQAEQAQAEQREWGRRLGTSGASRDEHEARVRKAGLWSEPDPTPPSDWRHGDLGGPTKKATASRICHVPGSASYSSVKKFTKYPTLEACLVSGGRLPKQSK